MSFYWQWWRFPYERSTWTTNHEQARRWYKALELAGVEPVRDQVRAALARGAGSPGGIPIWTEQSVTIGFCQEWLSWHDRRKAGLKIFWTVVSIVVPVLLAIIGWHLSN
jgi:hypothetical protein